MTTLSQAKVRASLRTVSRQLSQGPVIPPRLLLGSLMPTCVSPPEMLPGWAAASRAGLAADSVPTCGAFAEAHVSYKGRAASLTSLVRWIRGWICFVLQACRQAGFARQAGDVLSLVSCHPSFIAVRCSSGCAGAACLLAVAVLHGTCEESPTDHFHQLIKSKSLTFLQVPGPLEWGSGLH
jgi:hypothetical protein